MIIDKDTIFHDVLMKPILDGGDRLCILSAYATSAMAFRHLETIREWKRPLLLDLVIGMTPFDGISLTNHRGFQKLVTDDFAGTFQCSYVHRPPSIHSKLYIWLREGEPFRAFAGSANYTQQAFGQQRELVVSCDPVDSFDYFDSIVPETIYCDHNDAEHLVQVYNDKEILRRQEMAKASEEAELQQTLVGLEELAGLPRRCVSFLANDGELPQTSGLNWGQREGREPNQAYIKLPASIYHGDFFPPVAVHFTVLTDDRKVMICTRAQQNGKAIHTPHNNSEIGVYFRRRLGVPLDDAVTRQDLENYGRSDVCFYKIDDETYFMDFRNAV
ncbi:MAG: NgoFVII family restriction endonuclease [Chloracidobacterium sp.]|nr:NgoFVII family restriction endonuclease [Chloracidobacterium sp.]